MTQLPRPLPLLGVCLFFLLGLSACGGGGGGGSTVSTTSGPVENTVQMGGAMQTGNPLALAAPQASNTTSTLAGYLAFRYPTLAVNDGAGDLYILEPENYRIQKIVIATGQVSTAVYNTSINTFFDGITTDGNALFLTTGSGGVYKVAPSSGTLADMTSANAVMSAVEMAGTGMSGVTTDGTALYAATTLDTVVKIIPSSGSLDAMTTSNAVVTTLAGTANTPGSTDGTGVTATFNNPAGITLNGNTLFVADTGNNTIRKITPTSGTLSAMTSANANVTTLAGTVGTATSTDGTGLAATFNTPSTIVTDGNALFVLDTGDKTVRKIVPTSGTLNAMTDSNAAVTTLSNQSGSNTNFSMFSSPAGLATDGNALYVVNNINAEITKIAPSSGSLDAMTSANAVNTVFSGNVEHDGTGTGAYFDTNEEATTDGVNLYVTDCGMYGASIRKINLATGQVTTLAGSATDFGTTDGTGTAARFDCPAGITTDGNALFVVDEGGYTIRKIAPSSGTLAAMTSANAVVTTLAGTAGTYGSADGTGLAATFYLPWGITTDGNALFVVDDGGYTIRKIAPSSGTLDTMTRQNAVVTTLAGTAGTSGSADGTGTAALFYYPYDITTDGKALYVTDASNDTIRKIAPSSGTLDAMTSANAAVTTLAGLAGTTGSSDGVGSAALFINPNGITTDGSHLYVTDSNNDTIRMITPLSGSLSAMTSGNANVTTLTGTVRTTGITDGNASSALFDFPLGITTDGTALYAQDGDNLVRKIQ